MWMFLAKFLNVAYVAGLLWCVVGNPPTWTYVGFVPLFAAMIYAELRAEGDLPPRWRKRIRNAGR